MLDWFADAHVARADLAVRRRDGAVVWHPDRALDELPLAWARAENVRRADVYVRPARGYEWPLVFLDDVEEGAALLVQRKYRALVVRTSQAGGCHVWLSCSRALDEEERRQAQRWLADRIGADRASISGEHLGRLAGFKNWKRQGEWVNALDLSSTKRAWDPCEALRTSPSGSQTGANRPRCGGDRTLPGPDPSESGREWGWVCGALEAGLDPERVYSRLVERARARRGADAERYARRTVDQALLRVATRS